MNREVSGSFSGTSTFNYTGCGFVHQTFDARYTTSRAKVASIDINGCVDFGTGFGFRYTGTFVLTTSNNAVLKGTVAGGLANSTTTGCGTLVPLDFYFTLTVESGTKAYQHATGTIAYQGTWCDPQAPVVAGPIFGTLTGNLS